MAQQQAYKSGLGCSFVTLTYTESRLPTVSYSDGFIGTLRREHFSKFWHSVKDRLRNCGYPSSDVAHFSCGDCGIAWLLARTLLKRKTFFKVCFVHNDVESRLS